MTDSHLVGMWPVVICWVTGMYIVHVLWHVHDDDQVAEDYDDEKDVYHEVDKDTDEDDKDGKDGNFDDV